jgi:hypothetical protein
MAAERRVGQRCHPSLRLWSPTGQLPEIDGRGAEEGLDFNLRAPTELRPGEPMVPVGVGVDALADHLAPAKSGSATPGPCACLPLFDGHLIPPLGNDPMRMPGADPLPRIGQTVNLAQILAEVGPILDRATDLEQAAAECGASPVTRASGKSRSALQRFNPLLRGAASATWGSPPPTTTSPCGFNPLLRGAASATLF